MTGQKRCCATCYFLEDMKMSGSGWCTHPKRKSQSDAKIVVRKGELACRNSWGSDFWADAAQPANLDDSDDRLAASGPASSRVKRPDQMWLPDPDPNSNHEPTPSTSEDIRVNEVAHLEQEDRAESLRLGPRDAINRAWARSSERKIGNQRAMSGSSPIIDNADTPASDPEVVQIEAADQELQRNPVPDPDLVSPIDDGDNDRLLTPYVPVTDIASQSLQSAEEKFYEIPDIRSDVELPRLRNQFSVPKHRTSGTIPATGSSSDSQASQYDLVLKRAQEIKETKLSQTNLQGAPEDHSQDRVTSSFTKRKDQPARPPIEADDEIVHFQADVRESRTRFSSSPEYDDDIHEDELDDDFELDRSYRQEETTQQSGTRWWHTFGRSRVFRPGHEEPFATLQQSDQPHVTNLGLDHSVAEPEPPSEPIARFNIRWDDSSLAPAVPSLIVGDSQSQYDSEWSTLDYLDDSDPSEMPIQPLVWQEPERQFRASKSKFTDRSSEVGFDPASREGMDHLRDQLFGVPGDVAKKATETRPPSAARPVTLQRAPRCDLQSEQPDQEQAPIKSRDTSSHDRNARSSESEVDDFYETEYNPDFDLRRIVKGFSEPALDMTIMISPEIPRKCATCRSFRRSGNGSRGWCTNVWAFSHRPLVDTEDLACESTIGCWWLPEDEEWDPSEFLGQLAVPTPRIDQLIAQLYGSRERMTS